MKGQPHGLNHILWCHLLAMSECSPFAAQRTSVSGILWTFRNKTIFSINHGKYLKLTLNKVNKVILQLTPEHHLFFILNLLKKEACWPPEWDHLTCLLRNVYAGQEAAVRTGHGTMDWFKIGKGVRQGSILSPCLFNFYAENIMWNARLEESQARIKIARRNINNLRCADYTTLMAEREEELKSLLMRVKEETGEKKKLA